MMEGNLHNTVIMDEELYALHTTLNLFERSIIKKMEKIDEILLKELNNYENTSASIMVDGEYNIPKNMLEVLRNYKKILFLSGSALELVKLEHRNVKMEAPVKEIKIKTGDVPNIEKRKLEAPLESQVMGQPTVCPYS